MDPHFQSMRSLAQQLLADGKDARHAHEHDVVRVCETLRISLTRFAGPEGYASLLRRALVLASAEVPAIQSIKVGADGRLEGLENLAAGSGGAPGAVETQNLAAVAVTTHLLGLLVTFIGVPFTLRLVREAWPGLPLDNWHTRIESDR